MLGQLTALNRRESGVGAAPVQVRPPSSDLHACASPAFDVPTATHDLEAAHAASMNAPPRGVEVVLHLEPPSELMRNTGYADGFAPPVSNEPSLPPAATHQCSLGHEIAQTTHGEK